MKSHDIRKKFQQYFINQGHTVLNSAPLVPKNDQSLLFTNAGMNQFKDFFLGLSEPPHPKICTIQKCIRAGGKHNDLEQVGPSSYHHTFFEMLGNFSFGAYFKKEAIYYAVEFLTKKLNLPPHKLWVSVFKEDKESAKIWQTDHNFPKNKLLFLGEKDNFWRMGDTGPCGPCTEIYYYDGTHKNPPVEDMTEIWNLVFMEFNEYFEGGVKKQKPLPRPAVDTGMGLERLSAVLQGKKSNYHTDLFKEIINSLEKATKVKYNWTQDTLNENQTAFRVMADHSRAVAFLIGDGVLPGSEGASYVLRRLLRRSFFYGQKLSPQPDLLCVSTKKVVDFMGDVYPALSVASHLINSTIKAEAKLFSESLRDGKAILLKKINTANLNQKKSAPLEALSPNQKAQKPAPTNQSKKIDNKVVWDLYSTYGFPPDLTRLIAKEHGFMVSDHSTGELKKMFSTSPITKTVTDNDKENKLKKTVEIYHQWRVKQSKALPTGQWTGYKTREEKGQVLLALPYLNIKAENLKKDFIKNSVIPQGERGFVILDKTCFYPEGGGPVGDTGVLKWITQKNPKEDLAKSIEQHTKSYQSNGWARVLDTQKRGDIIIHEVEVIKGDLQTYQVCNMAVDKDHRRLISASHSATHLLHKALRVVLGDGVRQMGSLVEPGQLRFDFSSAPLTVQQLKKIEDKVNQFIQAGHKVFDFTCSYQEAVDKGALFLAQESYPEEVRLIHIGESLELCGGIHVQNTLDIGGFKIISETGVQSGVRRIVAYVSDIRQKWLKLMSQQNEELRKYLNLSLPKWGSDTEQNPFISLIQKKTTEITSLKKQIKKLSTSLSQSPEGTGLIKKDRPFERQGIKALLLTVTLPIEDRKTLAETADNIKSQAGLPAVVIAIGTAGDPSPIVVTVAKELQKHISAGDLLKNHIAPFLNGKGGGQARFAQGVIKERSRFAKLDDMLIEVLKV